MSTQPLRFGVDVPADAADPGRLAREAEALGFDLVSTWDHPGMPGTEAWTQLTWMAAQTSTIGVLSRVLSVPFRPPALVARMAAGLQRLSGDRLVLGLGGGAADAELEAFGLPVPTPREKVDGLRDAVGILHDRWDAGEAAPVWLGTFGPRALAMTGAVADGWIPSLGFAAEEDLPRMRAAVLAGAERAGRDPADVVCALNVELAVEAGDPGNAARVEGSATQVADRLQRLAELGFSVLNVKVAAEARDETLRRFCEDVVPRIRARAAA